MPDEDIRNKVIIALDVADMAEAMRVVEELGEAALRYKVGKQLLYSTGLGALNLLKEAGKGVLLDAKLHDIPNTVTKAVEGIVRQEIWGFTIHSLGGSDMLRAAVETVRNSTHFTPSPTDSKGEVSVKPLVIAVTVLTSLSEPILRSELLITCSIADYVVHLARLAHSCGCDGVVASGQDVERIKENCAPDFIVVVPGVRPEGKEANDQQRVITPAQAIRMGADYLVVGRPVVRAVNRREALMRLLDEVAAVV